MVEQGRTRRDDGGPEYLSGSRGTGGDMHSPPCGLTLLIQAMHLLSLFVFALPVAAQLKGKVGPTTSTESKRAKVCDVTKYGGVASKGSDIGPAITKAFAACKTGGTGMSYLCLRFHLRSLVANEYYEVYIPPGDYGMSTGAEMSGGQDWALQLDGTIYRTGYDSWRLSLPSRNELMDCIVLLGVI